MRLGVRLDAAGLDSAAALLERGRAIESAGFDSVWVGDHVALPETIESIYPLSRDGTVPWSTTGESSEALVVLGVLAAATARVELGTAVLVAPLRHPLLVAKQVATIERLSGGRLALGVGVGWLREEFEALGVPYEGRGARTAEWIELLREALTGRVGSREGRYPVARPLRTQRSSATPPVLIGGTSEAAIRRAVRVADGWIGHESLDELDLDRLAAQLALIAGERRDSEAEGGFRIVLRLVSSRGRVDEVAALVPALARLGVDDLVIDQGEEGALADERRLLAAAM